MRSSRFKNLGGSVCEWGVDPDPCVSHPQASASVVVRLLLRSCRYQVEVAAAAVVVAATAHSSWQVNQPAGQTPSSQKHQDLALTSSHEATAGSSGIGGRHFHLSARWREYLLCNRSYRFSGRKIVDGDTATAPALTFGTLTFGAFAEFSLEESAGACLAPDLTSSPKATRTLQPACSIRLGRRWPLVNAFVLSQGAQLPELSTRSACTLWAGLAQ